MCTVNRITRNAWFTVSVGLFPSSRFAITKFYSVCVALSTVPFPVCIRGVQYSISIFRFLQNSRYSFEIKEPPLSDLIFSGIPYRLKLLDRYCITYFVSEVLQIFTVGHLLNLSTTVDICTSPWMFLLCKFLVKSVSISCPGLVSFSSFP